MRAGVVLLLCVGAFVRPCVAQCPDGSPPPCTARPRVAAAPAPTSVAVLYFDNLSRDTSDTYLAEGLTDELITRLGQVDRLQVKSRGAVRRFRGSTDDPVVVGRALGVAHLVSGSVRREGDRLRVTVELTRAATGAHVWGDVFDRTSRDLMSVESDIASAIATAVGGRLAPSERQVITARPTTNPAAYDHVLRGDFLLAHRNGGDARRAVAEYEAAVALDPAFARAWAHMSLAWYLFLDWDWPHPGLSRDSVLALGSAASERALAADSLSADGWATRGLLLTIRNAATHEGVIPALQRAVRLDPRNAEAWHQLGSVLMVERHDAEAESALTRSLALDPQRMITLSNLAQVLIYQGRDRESLVYLDSAVAVAPEAYFPHVVRGQVRVRLRDLAGAREDGEAVQRLRPRDFSFDSEPLLIALRLAAGDTAEARARADALARQVPATGPLAYGSVFGIALGYALVGDYDHAIASIERGRISGINMWWQMQDPFFGGLRSDPRYRRLLDELKPRVTP